MKKNKQHSEYNWTSKNYSKDLIYSNRLKLILRKKININSSHRMYSYYTDAFLGIILM